MTLSDFLKQQYPGIDLTSLNPEARIESKNGQVQIAGWRRADAAPTAEQVDAWKAIIASEAALRECQAMRRAAYPREADFLDAQVKILSSNPDIQIAGQAQLAAYVAACLAVKAKFPKPE